MKTRKGNVAGATSGASSGPPTSPPLLCCCCCAAVVVLRSSCVSALHFQVVQFHLGVGSCAYILPQNIQLYCCVVPPVVAHLKKTQALGWNFEVHSPNKSERQVPPPSPLLLMLLLQLYCFCCAMLLLLWYSDQLGLLCVPTAPIHHSYTCGTSCSPQDIGT